MLDFATLVLADATVLLVMVMAFAIMAMREREASYWMGWVVSSSLNAAGACALAYSETVKHPAIFAMSMFLLIGGAGTCWRAARQFSGRSAPWRKPIVYPAVACTPLMFDIQPAAREYLIALLYLIICIQYTMVSWEFWRDRADGFTSRYGLITSYGFLIACFAFASLDVYVRAQGGHAFSALDQPIQASTWLSLLHTAGAGVFRLSLALERSAANLRRLTLVDALTGLPNRRAFSERFSTLCHGPKAAGYTLALIDIDYFKRVNDRHGHAAGDDALRACATMLQEAIGRYGIVARIGGEEFAVLISHSACRDAREALDKVRKTISETAILIDESYIYITVSIGTYQTEGVDTNIDFALRQADACLYAAKNAGRNRIVAAL